LILMLAVAISQINLIPAKASLGNQGIPVRCYISGSVTAGTSQFMTCVSAAAPYFVSSQRVPSGYYFLVTDVFVTPATGGTGDTPVGFYLYDAYGTSSRASSYVFRSVDGASYGQHFIVPLYVLTADHRLEVQAFGGNATSFEIRMTGLLVNSVTYLPMLYNNP
jgi:hypothetical protein